MHTRLVGQPKSGTFGELLLEAIKVSGPDSYNRLTFCTAFLKAAGLSRLKTDLERASERGVRMRAIVGVDHQVTSREGIELAYSVFDDLYIAHSTRGDVTYHPKIYDFRGEKSALTLVGSSNLTSGGLFSNSEAGVVVNYDLPADKNAYDEVASLIESYLESDANIYKIDDKNLDWFASNLPTEKSRSAGSAGDNGLTSRWTDIFGAGTFHKAPSAPKEEKEVPAHSAEEASEKRTLPGGRIIWFETRAMTSPAVNQLDLSSKGRINKAMGGAALFGVNVSDRSDRRILTITYNGEAYYPNNLYFPLSPSGKTNGTWRLQLNGESSNDAKFTDHTRDGQLKNSILAFRQIGSDSYEMTVHSLDKLDAFKARSTFHDETPPSNGRAYGEIIE